MMDIIVLSSLVRLKLNYKKIPPLNDGYKLSLVDHACTKEKGNFAVEWMVMAHVLIF